MQRVWMLGMVLLVGCASGEFASLERSSRDGRDQNTIALAQTLLADPALPAVTRARVEVLVALAHRRQQEWDQASLALERAEAAGIARDEGWYHDYWLKLKAELGR